MNLHIERVIGVLAEELKLCEAENKMAAPHERTEVQSVLANLRATAADLVQREGEREQAIQNHLAHAEILPKCRQARDRFEQAERDFAKTELDLENARSHLSSREDRLAHALNLTDEYPTPAEIKAHEAICQSRRDDLEAARAGVRRLNTLLDTVRNEALKAQAEFNYLTSQERRLRPKEQQSVKAWA